MECIIFYSIYVMEIVVREKESAEISIVGIAGMLEAETDFRMR